jgi:hypothetical protein
MHHELQTDHSTEHEPVAAVPEALAPSVLSEDLALSQLNHREITADAIEKLTQNAGLMKSRKVRMALASHPRTPRRIALRVIRELYTFELMQLALLPGTAGDLRRVADEFLLSRLSSITLGERISLARRSSGRIAGALLLDKETPVWQAALENPRLTESAIVKALQRSTAVPAFVESVSHHMKWSVRPETRVALLRNAHTPFARAIEFARRIPPAQLRDILHTSGLPERIKQYLNKHPQKSTL